MLYSKFFVIFRLSDKNCGVRILLHIAILLSNFKTECHVQSCWWNGCLSVVSVVCCQGRSLRRADHSLRRGIPSVVCLTVIVKRRLREVCDPLGTLAPWQGTLLTPWCRVLLEKLTGLKLVKKFPVFYGTRRFITALTSVRHLSLSWASPIQSTYPHPTSWRSILMLSTHLHLGIASGLFPSG
jgi:hypothetical protein